MSALLRQRRTSSIIVALISMLLGVVLILYKARAVSLIVLVSGVALMALGAYYIGLYFARRSRIALLQMDLLLGIILFLLGLWMAARPDSVISLLQYVAGAIILVHGVVDLQAAFNIKRGGFEKWWVSLLLAVVTLLLGALIIIDPFAALDALLILIGLVLIFDGLSDLYIIFRISRVFREVKQAAADARQEAGAVETEGTVTDDASAETDAAGTPPEDDGASGKTE
ncbi:MAG TPA: DUF308 domain-containing protein [Oscillospiraceae bacterium]|nr:DUF308 domain-containing protein [Oscillospiraceae bacterium]HPS75965.1 DUF308 domain-containing protein [Oscillospiraceae bacterium]